MTDEHAVAATIVTQAYSASTIGFSIVYSLRSTASKFESSAWATEAFAATQFFLADSSLQEAFAENASLVVSALGGFPGIFAKINNQYAQSYRGGIDAASLIFSHSILDAAVYEYCRASTIAAPDEWEQFVKDKKVSLSEVKRRDYKALLQAKISEFLKDLERISLLEKVDKLFAVCKPESVPQWYSRERLGQLDNLRHSIVHGRSTYTLMPSIDNDVKFLTDINYFFLRMVMKHHSLEFKMDIFSQGLPGEEIKPE